MVEAPPFRKLLYVGIPACALGLLLLVLSLRTVTPSAANPLDGFRSIEAGGYSTCGITTAGGLRCWGLNDFATLTDGGACGIYCFNPVDSTYFTSGVLDVTLGENHTCVLLTGGAVQCVGSNLADELGDGGACGDECHAPVNVSGLSSGVVAIAAGGEHSCAILAVGSVTCWGDGAAPSAVSGITNATMIAVGNNHACALTSTGGAKCWGGNYAGQLGDGTTTDSASAVDVSGLTSGVAIVSAGNGSSCAVTTSGAAKCWGSNNFGNLGDGTTTDSSVPVNVSGLGSGATSIDAGARFACALLSGGFVKCWGQNDDAELGDGTFVDRLTPVGVTGIAGATQQSSSSGFFDAHSCALLAGGGVRCWGPNTYGQVGDGQVCGFTCPVAGTVSSAKPTPTPPPCMPACPTPAPQLDFSIAIDTDNSGTDDCGTRPALPTSCALPPGAQFKVKFYLHGLPPTEMDYGGYDAYIAFTGVAPTGFVDFSPWPDCVTNVTAMPPGAFAWGCIVGPVAPDSTYLGLIAAATFTCDAAGAVALRHANGETTLVVQGTSGPIEYHESPGTPETLNVTCDAVATPTPNPVGGLGIEPPSSSANTTPISAVVALAIALVGMSFAAVALRRKRSHARAGSR